jgi:Glyoxalase-like domain
MLNDIIPKLPMRNKTLTKEFYLNQLSFELISEYGDYILLKKDQIEIHFFEFKTINPLENYGQVYIRVLDIDDLYKDLKDKNVSIHPNGNLEIKPWGQKEFSLLDPDNNLLTFGQAI